MLDRFGYQGDLVRPAQVEAGLAHPRPGGDLVHGQPRVADPGEQVHRRSQDGLVHFGVARAAAARARLLHLNDTVQQCNAPILPDQNRSVNGCCRARPSRSYLADQSIVERINLCYGGPAWRRISLSTWKTGPAAGRPLPKLWARLVSTSRDSARWLSEAKPSRTSWSRMRPRPGARLSRPASRSSMSAMPWSPRLRTDLVSWVSCCGGSRRPASI